MVSARSAALHGAVPKSRSARWIFTQTMSQLASDELYGQTGFKAIFGLCSIKQSFSIREPEVAQLASDLCGQRTADNITENTRGESVGNVGVPLIRPEKVRGLRKWRQIDRDRRTGQSDQGQAGALLQAEK